MEHAFVFGAGKVGRALAPALRRAGLRVTLRAARAGLPARVRADLVILALRDRDLEPAARALAGRLVVPAKGTVVAHCAGALGPEPLAALRGPRTWVAQFHPMISFASVASAPSLEGGQLHVDGDPEAERRLHAIGAKLGLAPRTVRGLDHALYHAAAGLVANGAAALSASGMEMLVAAGVDAKTAVRMLGPLLRSVAHNVEHLGFPAALTGPVRRGDAAGIARHLAMLEKKAPAIAPLYLASARAQLPLARALGEASPAAFDELAAMLARS